MLDRCSRNYFYSCRGNLSHKQFYKPKTFSEFDWRVLQVVVKSVTVGVENIDSEKIGFAGAVSIPYVMLS